MLGWIYIWASMGCSPVAPRGGEIKKKRRGEKREGVE